MHHARLPGQVHAVHGSGSVGQGGRRVPEVHLWPGLPLLPQAQPRAEVRHRAGVAAARSHVDQRLPATLVARREIDTSSSDEEKAMATVETPRDQKEVVKEISWY